MIDIRINGDIISTDATSADYQWVVDHADSGRSKKLLHSVVYERGPSVNNRGILIPGQTVLLCNGMIFNAYVTDSA